ncbi:SAM-dependent methyltransferase [Streptomyces sp. M19]
MTDLDHAAAVEIDTTKPHPARMYDFYLQGRTTTRLTRSPRRR